MQKNIIVSAHGQGITPSSNVWKFLIFFSLGKPKKEAGNDYFDMDGGNDYNDKEKIVIEI